MSTESATSPVALGGDLAPNPVMATGEGSPVVFLHGPFGQEWTPYLDDLAVSHRVFAPANPGAEEPEDLRQLDGFWDLVLYYDELFDRLGLGQVDIVGHSYGGMVAAEYAATYPGRVRKLVLIDPLGLWLDEHPVNEFITVAPEILLRQLWADPTRPEVAASTTLPEDPAEALAQVVRRFSALSSVAHFTFPIPERGLAKRLRRIKAETLIMWGRQDGLVPPVYAEEFAAKIAGSTVALVDGGHFPHVEQRAQVARQTLDFLGSAAKGDGRAARP